MSTLNNPFRPNIFSPTQGDGGGYYETNPFYFSSNYNFFNPNLSFANTFRERSDIFSTPFSSSSAQGIFGKSGGSIFQQGGGGTATDLIGDTKVGLPAADAAAAGGGGMFSNMSAAQQMQMAGGIGGIIQGLVGRKKRRAAQRKAKKEYEKQRALYQALDTSNLAAGFGNAFENMENTYEDMTVNQQQAQFMAQQNQQSQANTMQALRGAAGGSGIAALAQSLAQQGQLAAQKSAAGIGQQEANNQAKKAQAAANIQLKERSGAADVANKIAMGEAASQTRELNKQSAIFDDASKEFQSAQGLAAGAQAQKDDAIGGAISGGFNILGSLVGGGA